MTLAFADTYYFIALLSPNDEGHLLASDHSRLIDGLVTTEWILLEVADGFADTPHRELFASFRERLIAQETTHFVPLEVELHEEAITLYDDRPDKEWSLTDCMSFIVMKRLGLTDALTADHHFEQAGFKALLKQ